MPKIKKQELQAPKGMHDILPQEQPYWAFVIKKTKNIVEDYGFGRIDLPIVEATDLFVRSVGEGTDIVDKELYSFKTRGGEQLALRPEFTAGMARAYIEHGMHVLPQPVQLWTYGPIFRHDNPQAGRYRQFYQTDIEIYGDDTPAADAQVIFIAHTILCSLGLKNLIIKINSIGDQNCRPQYIKALKEYSRGRDKRMCAKCPQRLKTNPLRLLDCKEEKCAEEMKEAPQFVDYLDEECKRHFKGVLEFLDDLKVPYLLEPTLVRGLDYYTRTVFEIVPEKEGEEKRAQSSLCGGGRYDRLIQFLGGQKTPVTGWAMGVERIILALKEARVAIHEAPPSPKIFLVQLGEMAKRKSLALFENFRKAGIIARATFGRDSIKSQLKLADKLGIKYTLIMGQKESLEGTIIVREMDSGVQETIPVERIVEFMKQKLKK